MQEAIELVKKYDSRKIPFKVLLFNLEQLLEKEKEHIMDFFLKGYSIGESDLNPKVEFEKYYKQTYNQNK